MVPGDHSSMVRHPDVTALANEISAFLSPHVN
jgi:hypothetical protein